MKLVDARKGEEIHVGQTVKYPDFRGKPDGYVLLGVNEGLSTITFAIRQLDTGKVLNVVGPVRYFHPKGVGLLGRVGIFPS